MRLAGVAGAATALALAVAAAGAEEFDCVVDPARSVDVASPVRGVIAKVLVERGDAVVEDQVIALLEHSVEAATVEINRTRAEDASRVESAQERLSLADKALERALQLQESNVVSQKTLDELYTSKQLAQKELDQARVDQHLAQLELERSQAVLELRTVSSPVAGVVTARHLAPGEFVTEDLPVATVVELDPLYVETYVPQGFYGRIGVGEQAEVELSVPAGERRPAKVTVVDPVFDPASGTFGVRLELPNPDRSLPGGVRCRVRFAAEASAPETGG